MIFFMKEALSLVPLIQPPSLALSLLMLDFRVHNSLTNHQNYKLVLPSSRIFQKDVLPIVPLLQSPKPGSPFTTGGF